MAIIRVVGTRRDRVPMRLAVRHVSKGLMCSEHSARLMLGQLERGMIGHIDAGGWGRFEAPVRRRGGRGNQKK